MESYLIISVVIIIILLVISNNLFLNWKFTKRELILVKEKLSETETQLLTIKDVPIKKLKMIFFVEEYKSFGFFRNKHIISFYQHLYIDGIPYGTSSLIKQDVFKEITEEQVKRINKILDEYAKPVLDAGIEVARSYFTFGGVLRSGKKTKKTKQISKK